MAILNQKDVRVTIISRIWAHATAMLLILFLLLGKVRDSKAIVLPLTVVFGATISTIVVLRKLRERGYSARLTSETLQELKQRLENLEEIVTSDRGMRSSASPAFARRGTDDPKLEHRSPQPIN